MCAVEKVAACEVSFLPIVSENYSNDVKMVLDIIENSGLEFDAGEMSTLIRGSSEKIFALLSQIYNSLDDICSFSMVVKISNLCGCSLKQCT